MERLSDDPPGHGPVAEVLDRLRSARTVGAHHLRVPDLLLSSKHHNANAVAIVLLLDRRSGKGRPAIFRQEHGIAALGITQKQWKDALHQLVQPHDDHKGVAPVFVQVTRRGQGRASARSLVATASYVKFAVWHLDRLTDPDPDRRIAPKHLRLLGGYLLLASNNDERNPWCEANNAKVARVSGLSPNAIDGLRCGLESSGLVIVNQANGRRTAVLPLAHDLTNDKRADLAHDLADLLLSRDGDRQLPPARSKPAAQPRTTPRNGAVNEPEPAGAELREHLRTTWRRRGSEGDHEQTA